MHDLIIEGARICDGSGAPAFEASVAVGDGRIREIGAGRLGLSGTCTTVDAQGLTLAPGVVDIHTHYDAQLTWDGSATPSPQMGVTTVVVGNCGFGIAPCRPEHRDLTLRNLTKVEGMPLAALLAGVDWRFESFAEYLDDLERGGVVPNVACLASHSCIRTFVMGGDAARREASASERKQMAEALRQCMMAGAIGFGTSTLEGHNGDGGVPMPSRFADAAELRALAAVLGDFGRGVFQITKGETPTIEYLEALAAENGRPIQICPMLQDPGHPEAVFEFMDAYAAAGSRGHELYGQVSPFPEIMDFNLHQPFPFESIDAWRPAMEASDATALSEVFRDASFRAQVKTELATQGAPFRFSNQWNTMTIKTPGSEASRNLMGKTVATIAAARGVHPLDCVLDIALEDELETEFTVGMFNAVETEVARLITHPRSCIGLGDAGAHLTFFCQAGTGLFLIQRYVRERGDLTLEDAIRRLTAQPAEAMRIADRGRIEVGAHADLFLFDPDEAGIGPRRLVDDLPGGLERVHTPALGVHGVWVNGVRVVDEGGLIDDAAPPGEVLRSFGA